MTEYIVYDSIGLRAKEVLKTNRFEGIDRALKIAGLNIRFGTVEKYVDNRRVAVWDIRNNKIGDYPNYTR